MDLLARLEEMDRVVAAGGNPLAPAPVREAAPLLGAVPSLAFAPGGAFAAVAPVVQQTASGTNTFSPDFLLATDAPAALPPTERMLPVAAQVVAQAAEVAPGQINPPKRRGRPPGAKNKTTEAATTAMTTDLDLPVLASAVPEDPPTLPATPVAIAAAAPAGPAGPAGHRIARLYVGCIPRNGIAADLDMIVAKAKVAIGPSVYFQNYGYKANGMLLQMVEGIIQHERPHSLVIAHPNAAEATLCLSYLLGISDEVVEAVR